MQNVKTDSRHSPHRKVLAKMGSEPTSDAFNQEHLTADGIRGQLCGHCPVFRI